MALFETMRRVGVWLRSSLRACWGLWHLWDLKSERNLEIFDWFRFFLLVSVQFQPFFLAPLASIMAMFWFISRYRKVFGSVKWILHSLKYGDEIEGLRKFFAGSLSTAQAMGGNGIWLLCHWHHPSFYKRFDSMISHSLKLLPNNLETSLIIRQYCTEFAAIPINKQLYSLSYVCFTAGAAGIVFSGFYILVKMESKSFKSITHLWISSISV